MDGGFQAGCLAVARRFRPLRLRVPAEVPIGAACDLVEAHPQHLLAFLGRQGRVASFFSVDAVRHDLRRVVHQYGGVDLLQHPFHEIALTSDGRSISAKPKQPGWVS